MANAKLKNVVVIEWAPKPYRIRRYNAKGEVSIESWADTSFRAGQEAERIANGLPIEKPGTIS